MSQLPTASPVPADPAPPPPARGAGAWSAGEWWTLLAISVLAAVLRLWQLDALALVVPEARTWQLASGNFSDALGLATTADAWTPLVPALLRVAADLGLVAMHEPGSLRLPFAFLGILTVPLLALVGAAYAGRPVALLAAALLALHPAHVAASQTAAAPVVATFGGVLLAAVLRTLHPNAPMWRCGLALAVFLLGVACDPSFWLLLAAVGVGLVDYASGIWLRLAGAVALLAGVLMPSLWLLSTAMLAVDPPDHFAAARPLWLVLALTACCLPAPLANRRAVQGMALLPPVWLALQALLGSTARDEVLVLALPAQCLLVALLVRALPGDLGAPATPASRPVRAFGGLPWPAWLLGLAAVGDAAVEVGLRATVFAGDRPAVQLAAAELLQRAGSARLRVHAGAALPMLAYYLRPDFWRTRSRRDASIELLPLGAAPRGLPLPESSPPRTAFAVLTLAEWRQRQQVPAGAARLRAVAVLPSVARGDSDTLYVCELVGPAGR